MPNDNKSRNKDHNNNNNNNDYADKRRGKGDRKSVPDHARSKHGSGGRARKSHSTGAAQRTVKTGETKVGSGTISSSGSSELEDTGRRDRVSQSHENDSRSTTPTELAGKSQSSLSQGTGSEVHTKSSDNYSFSRPDDSDSESESDTDPDFDPGSTNYLANAATTQRATEGDAGKKDPNHNYGASGYSKSGRTDFTCYSCGQHGHRKRDCPNGGTKGNWKPRGSGASTLSNDIQGQFIGLQGEIDGFRAAGAQKDKELDQLKSDLASAKSEAHDLSEELKVFQAEQEDEVLDEIQSMNFAVQPNKWKYSTSVYDAVVLFSILFSCTILLGGLIGVTLYWLFVTGVVQLDVFVFFAQQVYTMVYNICGSILIILPFRIMLIYLSANFQTTDRYFYKGEFKRPVHGDLRADGQSMRDLKHGPRYFWVTYRQTSYSWIVIPNVVDTDFLVSAEIMSQLWLPKNMDYTAPSSLIWERMGRVVESLHTVNYDRYLQFSQHNIHQDTRLVAYAMYLSIRNDREERGLLFNIAQLQ
jgi:hypothetical protein